ncbi:MAG: hypothetical protein RLZZ214_4301, partial [Verrucomicrobiota bacterium]
MRLNPVLSTVEVAFIEQNNDALAPIGAVSDAAKWQGAMLPKGRLVGLIAASSNVWP